jgi:hypothetical protein
VHLAPPWFLANRARLAFHAAALRAKWTRKSENSLRKIIVEKVPDYCPYMYSVNTTADTLHIEMLDEALRTGSVKWFERAMQFGRRHASFPLLYDWAELSTNLRKYVVYCVAHYDPESRSPTLPLLPCPRLRYIDYLEWLPSAGVSAGWNSIRHYAGQLISFSYICGHGSIVDGDTKGYTVWRENFSANIKVVRAPRGGDFPLRPWHLRRLTAAYPSSSAFDKMMLATCSLMWFTALRAGHFSPQSNSQDDCKHLLEWAHVEPYDSVAFGTPRPALHCLVPTAKTHQEESATPWTTATCCICEGADGDPDELRDLRLLCPVHSLERWRRVAPESPYVCCDCTTGAPITRTAFNKELRRALDVALSYIPAAERAEIIKCLSAKSWRSGAGTAIVTATNAGFVAAAFLGHDDQKTTKRYYHKGGDAERLQLVGPLTDELRGGPAAAGRLVSRGRQ